MKNQVMCIHYQHDTILSLNNEMCNECQTIMQKLELGHRKAFNVE